MTALKIVVHFFSIFWIFSTYKNWRNKDLSTSLFLIFISFITLANISPYLHVQFDQIAQFFGVEYASNLAFFISIITLFIWVKYTYTKEKKLERKLTILTRRLAISDFKERTQHQ
jgi:hypothetical protein